ncbi:MAG: motility protein A [Lachnospiraceae bacterium]
MKLNKVGLTGFLMCFMAIVFGIATNGGIRTVVNFLHIPSFIVTVGGALFAVMTTSDSFDDFIYGIGGFRAAFSRKGTGIDEIIQSILEMSETARKEGLLSLEEKSNLKNNAFLNKGISLVVDGSEPELIRDILETELSHKYDREKKQIKFWEDFGSYAPAWGMVGTLIGLINMMKTMGNDSSAIGSGMSLALITTLYGSILANWICIPISRKLEKNSEAEYLEMEVIIEGVLSIQAGENTRIIKEKMKAILEKEIE